MPARIAVHLEPTGTHPPVPPPHTGPAVNAAFLGAVRDAGQAELATALHESGAFKAYALTPLLDEDDQLPQTAVPKVRFEVGVLADPLGAPVLQALADTVQVRVARCFYRVADIQVRAAESYAQVLAAAQPADRWELDILTPVAFFTAREEGVRRPRPFPEAEWVFSSLCRRWNTFAIETQLGQDVADAILGNLEVADHRLTMAEHLLKAGVPPTRGSVGRVVYRLADPRAISPAVKAALNALSRFAAHAGIGDRTATGMGYVVPLI